MLRRFLFFLFALALSAADKPFDIAAHYTKQEFRISMRDGVRLFTVVYSPKGHGSYPLLLTRTPYGVEPYGRNVYPKQLGPSAKFAEDGFIFVYQDVRGRFLSEGTFVEMRPEGDEKSGSDESTDTFDTVAWLVKNVARNNGKVGLIGTSYPGFYVSAGLIHAHPAVVAASPQAPISDLYMGDDAYHNGAFFLLSNFGFYTSFRKQHNPERPPVEDERDFQYGTNDGYEFYLKLGGLSNSDAKFFHYSNPYWTDLIRHTTYDHFWQERNILPHLENIRPAVLVMGGWFDAEDLSGTLKTFRAIETQSSLTAVHLVMGPWAHGGWTAGKTGDKLGDIAFGADTTAFFQNEIELPFFRHYLKDGADLDLPKAFVFKTGKNVWQRERAWPPAAAITQKLYLRSDGQLSFEAPSEHVSDEPGFDTYTSDPAHPVPFFDKRTLEMDPEYMDADQRFAAGRPDVLSYQTTPLDRDTTIAGPISPSLSVSTTGSDSDFIVKLIDVYPGDAEGPLSGYEQLVRGEPFRGKFRRSFEHPEPFVPGQIQQIYFTMPDIYHCFRKGHRIMVQIQSSWFPLVDRNPQTFTDIPTATPSEFVSANERVYHSHDAPSFIEFPVEP